MDDDELQRFIILEILPDARSRRTGFACTARFNGEESRTAQYPFEQHMAAIDELLKRDSVPPHTAFEVIEHPSGQAPIAIKFEGLAAFAKCAECDGQSPDCTKCNGKGWHIYQMPHP